ncbi:MAG: 16S rRNA (uracil(1498)-N(3))-methyltransferase [Bacteroidetes bacterium]|jgi:16S rRNA (uracil1498-N3)-methyltransferase|nr:16S rRNA (uracil(1498)-N(3))-methyltransferase [Bacteroidota bacterium]
MDTFFVLPQDVHGSTLVLRGEEHRHLARSLRKRIGDPILATDGEDNLFEAVITSLGRDEAQCDVVQTHLRKNEARVSLTLAVSLLRNPARFDFLVEKATELGVRAIIPLQCERTIGRQDRHDRYAKIALAAMKQSGRCYLPKIFPVTSFEAVVAHAEDHALRLMPHERTEQSQFIGSLIKHHESAKTGLVLVGPEGGFSDRELQLAASHAVVPVSLGPRRLRSETAAMVSVAWVVGAT